MPNEWIDVHDKLPEPYEEVLICRYNSELKYNSIGLDQLIKVYSKVFWEDFSEHYKESVWRITHWMPIPPPPKERILEISKEDVTSADVVEVVRCSKCRHWGGVTFGFICRKFSGENTKICMHADDFCSYGERRSENEPT